MCDEQTIKEIEALQAALGRDVKECKRVADNHSATLAAVNELCTDIVKKQIANQLHIPDNFEGIKEIKTCSYEVDELKSGKLCMNVVKVNGEWNVCNKVDEQLPMNNLSAQSLHNVEDALLEVWEGILDWEAQWD